MTDSTTQQMQQRPHGFDQRGSTAAFVRKVSTAGRLQTMEEGRRVDVLLP